MSTDSLCDWLMSLQLNNEEAQRDLAAFWRANKVNLASFVLVRQKREMSFFFLMLSQSMTSEEWTELIPVLGLKMRLKHLIREKLLTTENLAASEQNLAAPEQNLAAPSAPSLDLVVVDEMKEDVKEHRESEIEVIDVELETPDDELVVKKPPSGPKKRRRLPSRKKGPGARKQLRWEAGPEKRHVLERQFDHVPPWSPKVCSVCGEQKVASEFNR
jgi:hypothetical protein